jgi:hypothetical protein
MLQMKTINWIILINPFKLIKKPKLDAQNNPQLQTFVFGDIVSVQSICTFIVIMKTIKFVLDCLCGINDSP